MDLVLRLINSLTISHVIPANPRESGGRAGIQEFQRLLDSRFRGNDERWATVCLTYFCDTTLETHLSQYLFRGRVRVHGLIGDLLCPARDLTLS